MFGTLLTMVFLQLFNTRFFAIISAVALAMFAFYGLGLSVVQGLPITPRFRLTTISRLVMPGTAAGFVCSIQAGYVWYCHLVLSYSFQR